MVVKAGGYADASDFAIFDWSPSFNGFTSLGVGTTVEGWYTNRAGLIDAGLYVVFAGSPVIASTIYVDLPVACDTFGIQECLGSWVFRDNGSTLHYAGSVGVWDAGGTQASFAGAWDATATRDRIKHTIPFTVAATDILSARLSYRAAS